jgi:hypothetical protein
MLLENIELSRALSLIKQSTTRPTAQQFHNIFDIDACSLNCNDRKAMEWSRLHRSFGSGGEKKVTGRMIRKVNTKSFTAEELQASADGGCRSCEALSLIFSQIFPRYKGITNDSTVCTYTISSKFTICEHLEINGVTSIRRMQLFHPYSKLIFQSMS